MTAVTPTPEQQDAAARGGRFVLRACPGSGKTFTVALRLADRLRRWSHRHAGIAALSFTNVACAEIKSSLAQMGFEGGPGAPHFLGTLDSFLDSYLFLPFGHQVMGSGKRPVLVGFGERPWSQTGRWAWGEQECNKGCDLGNFSWDLDGKITDIGPKPHNCPLEHRVCSRLKARFADAGFATQADAAYWAVRILERLPAVGRALVRRFPELVIDEAQDTSSAQMRIIDLLVEAGLREVVLVGDPDQAVYQWRNARPTLIIEKQTQAGWAQPFELTRNHRSTQLICDATQPFSTLGGPSAGRAGGPRPQLWTYDDMQPAGLIERFLEYLASLGVQPTPATAATLVRGRTLLRRLLNAPEEICPWRDGEPITRLFAQAAWERDRGQNRASRRYVESAVLRLMGADRAETALQDFLDEVSDSEISVSLFRLLKALPLTSLPLKIWLNNLKVIVGAWIARCGWVFQLDLSTCLCAKRNVKKQFRGYWDWPVSSFFEPPKHSTLTVETVHAAKGKTYEAVMFAMASGGDCTVNAISKASSDLEAIRTAYVAMTRPRQVLVVAIPQKTRSGVLGKFAGFDRG